MQGGRTDSCQLDESKVAAPLEAAPPIDTNEPVPVSEAACEEHAIENAFAPDNGPVPD